MAPYNRVAYEPIQGENDPVTLRAVNIHQPTAGLEVEGSGDHHKWGTTETIMFVANAMVGTGFLTLPYAVMRAGLVAGVIGMVVIAGFASIAVVAILEVLARYHPAKAIMRSKGDDERAALVQSMRQGSSSGEILSTDTGGNFHWLVSEERIELLDAIGLFLGPLGAWSYTFSIAMYTFASLWAYSVLLGETLATELPLTEDSGAGTYSYLVYLAVFGGVTAVLSAGDLSGPLMRWANNVFTFMRIVMIFLMLITLVLGFFHQSSDDDSLHRKPVPLVNLSGLGQLLPTCLFSFVFHGSVSTLAEPVARKENLARDMTVTVGLVLLCYAAVAVPAVLYFGSATESALNLDWASYSPGNPFVQKFVQFVVVIFPAISLVTTYTLQAVTLANQLEVVLPNKPHLFYRIASSVPPIFAAAVMSDLAAITSLAGICGFFLVLVFPALVHFISGRFLESHVPGSSRTAYTSPLTSSPLSIAFIGLLGLFLAVSSFIDFVNTYVISEEGTSYYQYQERAGWS